MFWVVWRVEKLAQLKGMFIWRSFTLINNKTYVSNLFNPATSYSVDYPATAAADATHHSATLTACAYIEPREPCVARKDRFSQ